MISADVPFRQHDRAFARAFPKFTNPIVAVIEGAVPERVQIAAAALADALRADHGHFSAVDYPQGLPFFAQQGLLFLEVEELALLTDRLAEAQPLLAALAEDPSLGGLGAFASARPRAADQRCSAAGRARPAVRRHGRGGRGAARERTRRAVLARPARRRRRRRDPSPAGAGPATPRLCLHGAGEHGDRGVARRPLPGSTSIRSTACSCTLPAVRCSRRRSCRASRRGRHHRERGSPPSPSCSCCSGAFARGA